MSFDVAFRANHAASHGEYEKAKDYARAMIFR